MSDVERAIEIIGRKTSIPADGETFEDVEKAFDIALAALREKQERENRCNECSGIAYIQTNSGKLIPANCACGRKLEGDLK